ncbi:MAG: hypothetical protein LBU32_26065 [Clostridiales bacterium]|nr:hypothetical protein [Clostridiales bacterium]
MKNFMSLLLAIVMTLGLGTIALPPAVMSPLLHSPPFTSSAYKTRRKHDEC